MKRFLKNNYNEYSSKGFETFTRNSDKSNNNVETVFSVFRLLASRSWLVHRSFVKLQREKAELLRISQRIICCYFRY